MMTETAKLYIFILVKVMVAWEIKNLSADFLRNFPVDYDEILCVATIRWFVEAHAKFILHKFCSRDRTLLMRCYELYL